MDQLTPDNNRDPIIQELLNTEALIEDQVQIVETTRTREIETAMAELGTQQFELDMETWQFRCLSFPSKTELYHIDLPKPPKSSLKLDELERIGTHWTLFDPESCKKESDLNATATLHQIFLQQANGQLLLDHGDYLDSPHFCMARNVIFNGYPRSPLENLPLDICFSANLNYAVIADRGAGVLHLLDLNQRKLLHSVAVRSSGAIKAMNMAISEQKGLVYVSDNKGPHLTVIKLADGSASKLSPGQGLLGNIVLTMDEQFVFVIATKPNPGLKIIDANSGQMVKDIPIKGDLFSTSSDAPCDLMTLTPDGQNLLLMTYINDPEPFTPVISVIQVEKQKTTQRFSIKDGNKPALLGFVAVNPVYEQATSVLERLLRKEFITDAQVNQARMTLRQRALEQQMAREAAANTAATGSKLIDLEQRAFEEAAKEKEAQQQAAEEEGEEGAPPKVVFKPEKVDQMNISPAADDLIVKMCSDRFYQDTDTDLLGDPQQQEGLARLKMAATRARNELEWYNGSIIKLKDLADGHDLEEVIMRDVMVEMLHKYERDQLVTAGMKTVPSNCPNCTRPLFGSYICTNCGYEIERPEELLRRGIISIATAGSMDNLPMGHVLLIDISGHRILEIDAERHITWAMGKDMLSGESQVELVFPRDAVRLSTRNTLITDYSANRVMEMTPRGRVFWEFHTDISERHKLLNPIRATANGLNHVMIVDQGNHRVIEVGREHEILWEFGTPGKSGIEEGELNTPADVQRLVNGNILITDTGNHRVLEIEEHSVVWQYGNPENIAGGGYGVDDGLLSYPQSALRLNNGNTLIVDAGNLRVIEIEAETNKVIWNYSTMQGAEEHMMDAPFRAVKMPNNLVMILGESNVIEVDPNDENKVVWSCMLSDFQKKEVQVQVQTKEHKKALIRHGVHNPYMKVKSVGEDEEAKKAQMTEKMQEMLSKRLANRQATGGAVNKAHVSSHGSVKPEPLEFMLVDRTKNKVLRILRDGTYAWRFGDTGTETLNKPHTCSVTKDKTVLIADTDNHRVIEVNPQTLEIIWQFGQKGQSGSGQLLNRPRSAIRLASGDGHTLIADQGNGRVIAVDKSGKIIWDFHGREHLSGPFFVQPLPSNHVLITDWGAHTVIEVSPTGEVVWQFGEKKVAGADHHHLSYPEHAIRLKGGNTLITDTRNERIIEVNAAKEVVWELLPEGEGKFGGPTFCRRLPNGNTVLVHSSNRQIMEVTPEKKMIWKCMLPFEKPTVSATPPRPTTPAPVAEAAEPAPKTAPEAPAPAEPA